MTPMPVWNPDIPATGTVPEEQWQTCRTNAVMDNGFKVQWRCSSRTSSRTPPYDHDLTRARAACSSPSSVWSPGATAARSRSNGALAMTAGSPRASLPAAHVVGPTADNGPGRPP